MNGYKRSIDPWQAIGRQTFCLAHSYLHRTPWLAGQLYLERSISQCNVTFDWKSTCCQCHKYNGVDDVIVLQNNTCLLHSTSRRWQSDSIRLYKFTSESFHCMSYLIRVDWRFILSLHSHVTVLSDDFYNGNGISAKPVVLIRLT